MEYLVDGKHQMPYLSFHFYNTFITVVPSVDFFIVIFTFRKTRFEAKSLS